MVRATISFCTWKSAWEIPQLDGHRENHRNNLWLFQLAMWYPQVGNPFELIISQEHIFPAQVALISHSDPGVFKVDPACNQLLRYVRDDWGGIHSENLVNHDRSSRQWGLYPWWLLLTPLKNHGVSESQWEGWHPKDYPIYEYIYIYMKWKIKAMFEATNQIQSWIINWWSFIAFILLFFSPDKLKGQRFLRVPQVLIICRFGQPTKPSKPMPVAWNKWYADMMTPRTKDWKHSENDLTDPGSPN